MPNIKVREIFYFFYLTVAVNSCVESFYTAIQIEETQGQMQTSMDLPLIITIVKLICPIFGGFVIDHVQYSLNLLFMCNALSCLSYLYFFAQYMGSEIQYLYFAIGFHVLAQQLQNVIFVLFRVCRQIFEFLSSINQNLYDGDFFTCVRDAKNEREKELIQMLRRFQCSMQFSPVPEEPILEYLRGNARLEITIKFTPTIARRQLPLIQHVAERYFLIFMIVYPEYPTQGVEFQLMNQSVEQHFRDRFKEVIEQIHHSCEHSLIRTYKQLDNYFDEVCKQIEGTS